MTYIVILRMWLWEGTLHRTTHAPTSSLRSLFVCKHKQVQPLNTNALVRTEPKPPAGTLQADGKGAGLKKQPHLPKRAALFMDTGCSRHREERPGEEVEELGASWMLTAPGLLPSVLEINIKTQS